jgi:hypothetical protein
VSLVLLMIFIRQPLAGVCPFDVAVIERAARNMIEFVFGQFTCFVGAFGVAHDLSPSSHVGSNWLRFEQGFNRGEHYTEKDPGYGIYIEAAGRCIQLIVL